MLVEVMLYGQRIGITEWSPEKGASTFQYTAQGNNMEPSPIVMPIEGGTYETNRDHKNFHDLPYLLSDSMPDDFGNVMMKEWLKLKNLAFDDINPVDRLTYVGKRGMGALEYVPANHDEKINYDVKVGDLLEVAKNVLEGKQEISYSGIDKESLTEILRIGTSVGGARAKALIAIKRDSNNKIVEIKPGDTMQPRGYSYWLLKIDGANERSLGEAQGMGKIEYAYYKLARLAGIDISECDLHYENGRAHFLTERFDRTLDGEKIHMQTFGALAGIDYKTQKASSYEALFRVMKILKLPYYQMEEQYRRMMFNVIARNHDDHVKNFSFMMDPGGQWRISPAYDICYSYNPAGTWTSVHQSSINGKYDDFTKSDLMGIATEFGIKKANEIFDEIIGAVSQWSKIATELDIPKEVIKVIDSNLRINDIK